MKNGPSPIDRAIDVLEALAFHDGPELLRLSDIARQTGIHPSTAYRLLQRLAARGLVGRVDGRYAIGLRAFELGAAWSRGSSVAATAKPVMERLVAAVNETAHLGVLDGSEVAYVEKVESNHAVHTRSQIGRRMPAHSTAVGKALLAFLDDAELDARRAQPLTRRTENTILTWPELDRELAATRERGYSIDDAENEDGVRCVGAPIFGYEGRLVASLSISAPAQRFPRERVPELARILVAAANDVSARLGHPAPVLQLQEATR
jgi:DNA-binding IclR family transcriptional regulator